MITEEHTQNQEIVDIADSIIEISTHQRTPLGGKVEYFHYTKRVLFIQKLSIIYQTHVKESS